MEGISITLLPQLLALTRGMDRRIDKMYKKQEVLVTQSALEFASAVVNENKEIVISLAVHTDHHSSAIHTYMLVMS